MTKTMKSKEKEEINRNFAFSAQLRKNYGNEAGKKKP
jgi:hypothetical protein